MSRRLSVRGNIRQDGRAVQGAAFRSQSGLPGVGSNPTPVNVLAFILKFFWDFSYELIITIVHYIMTIINLHRDDVHIEKNIQNIVKFNLIERVI